VDLAIIVAVVVVALSFDYTNGFHDAANAIATSVSTRALTPRIALLMAAVMNFVGALLGQEVAHTVSDTIDVSAMSANQGLVIVLAALLGAIAWNLITWYFGLPSSSSHALIGGLVGSALTAGAVVNWGTITDKVLIPMVGSPLIGFTLAFALMTLIMWIFRRASPHRVFRGFRLAQTVSASALALGHGLQDAQKTMGVIFLSLVASGHAQPGDRLPLWVVIAAGGAISLGTYSGGWRIMRTLGRRIIHVDPARGFAAEATGAAVLYGMAILAHAPVSTTHTITSAIMGAGATKRFSAVRWGVARSILVAWILTLPAAGAMAAVVYLLLRFVFRLP
jgi:PiT family inorganic phosphate transporter